jgi:hypothetical protein
MRAWNARDRAEVFPMQADAFEPNFYFALSLLL